MNARTRILLFRCLAASVGLIVPVSVVFAQYGQPQDRQYASAPAYAFTQQELDQMLAPIALYPDALLTQILMASTYPLEVVQAARWSRANPGYSGEQAVRAVERHNWDPSVKSLAAFPQVLGLMDGNLEWTERLGNAFLGQQAQLWDSVQDLRQRASAAGNLRSNDDYRVEQDGPTYLIESPRPDVIYVPYYDPLIVYGDWWWPGYAPMRWLPWPGYYPRSGYGRGYCWDSGVTIGYGFFFGGIDWQQRHVNVINRNSFYYRNVNRPTPPGSSWLHDPDHRRGVPYRDPALRQQFNRIPDTPDARRDYRGRTPGPVPRVEPGGRSAVPGPSYASGPRPPVTAPTAQRAMPTGDVQRPQALEGVGFGRDAGEARGQASYPRPPVMRQPATIHPQPPPQLQRVAPAPPLPQPPPQQSQLHQTPNSPRQNAPHERGESRGEQSNRDRS